MDEISLLDYLKALITPWRGPAPEIPALPKKGAVSKRKTAKAQPKAIPASEGVQWLALPWRTLAAVLLALFAQLLLEPPNAAVRFSSIMYVFSFGLMLWAFLSKEWELPKNRQQEDANQTLTANAVPLYVGIFLAVIAFFAMGGNRFSSFNVFTFVIALLLILRAFWYRDDESPPIVKRWRDFIAQPSWNLPITRFGLVVMFAFGISVFFRVYQLNTVTQDMFSDHVEKLLDVYDVVNGQTKIFFERNTGREAGQMYLTAWVISIFNTGYSFLSLKLGALIAGLVLLVYMYLLGREIGNRYVGLIAMTLVGIAFWPNTIERVALRFIFYPAFVAPTLYYLLRGIRKSTRNDFILAGIALGIGLHTYSPIRALPIVVTLAVGLFLLHRQSKGVRRQTVIYFGILVLFSLILFIPLLRYITESPENLARFNYRTLTRIGTIEQPYPGSPVIIFFQNLWDALRMINFTNSSAWGVSIPGRPMLDAVSAALFLMGVALLSVRYLQKRNWQDIFLLLSIPILMLPSILSLAFPIENPTANRAAGAMVPVFLIAAIALESILRRVKESQLPKYGNRLSWGLGIVLVWLSASLNFGLTFNTFAKQYNCATWNTSEMGEVIAEFSNTFGDKDSAWVLVYPHWGDNRLVAIGAGLPPTANYELYPENLNLTLEVPAPKMFLVKPEHVEGLTALQELYPLGIASDYESTDTCESKSFIIFIVPPEGV